MASNGQMQYHFHLLYLLGEKKGSGNVKDWRLGID